MQALGTCPKCGYWVSQLPMLRDCPFLGSGGAEAMATSKGKCAGCVGAFRRKFSIFLSHLPIIDTRPSAAMPLNLRQAKLSFGRRVSAAPSASTPSAPQSSVSLPSRAPLALLSPGGGSWKSWLCCWGLKSSRRIIASNHCTGRDGRI